MIRTRCAALALLLAAACGEGGEEVSTQDEPAADPARRYRTTTTVLESPDHGPQLCLGGVADSLPPQCGGPDIVGWDWGAVDDEESVNGTTWGDYSVIGTWDGERFTLTEPPAAAVYKDPGDLDFSTPCEPPPGGWAVVDAETATFQGQDAALAYANEQRDLAGAWVDQSINPAAGREPIDEGAMNDPTKLVLNVRFTGDLERHEAAIRDVWGGPLCVSEGRHPLRELRALQGELHEELDALTSGVDEVHGVLEIGVVVVDPQVQESLDERYGPGVVELSGALEPVD